MKIRLTHILDRHCLKEGAAVLAHFVDFSTVAQKLPEVADALSKEVEYRGKNLTWALETARSYLEGKFQEMADAGKSALHSDTVEKLFHQVDALTRRTEELEARLAGGAAQ